MSEGERRVFGQVDKLFLLKPVEPWLSIVVCSIYSHCDSPWGGEGRERVAQCVGTCNYSSTIILVLVFSRYTGGKTWILDDMIFHPHLFSTGLTTGTMQTDELDESSCKTWHTDRPWTIESSAQESGREFVITFRLVGIQYCDHAIWNDVHVFKYQIHTNKSEANRKHWLTASRYRHLLSRTMFITRTLQ